MNYSRNRVTLATVLILVLCLCVLPIASLFSLVQAAPWTKYTGEVTLKDGIDNELFVVDAWVIKEGSTYKMWYTHSRTDMDIAGMADNLTKIISSGLISDFVNLNLAGLLSGMADIADDTDKMDALWNFMIGTTTVIGYAESNDGIVWSVVDDEVLAGASGQLESVGMPCVINDGGIYKMWFTHSVTSLDYTGLQTILHNLGNTDPAVVRNALIDLMNSTTSAIGYTSSVGDDETNWNHPDYGVFGGSGDGLWDSVATPCVIKDGTYKMWYTYAETDITTTDIDNILASIGSFDVTDLMFILDNTSTVIGYAESADGFTGWNIVKPEVLAGISGGVWDSVATPCVIYNGSNYEMWFTYTETDLTATEIQAIFDALEDMGPAIIAMWDSYDPGNLNPFLNNFTDLIDTNTYMQNIKTLLANTGNKIGYTTSTDGINDWTAPTEALAGSSGPWGSVGAPCVVWEDGVYKMWFMQGIDELTAQNLLDIMQGDILPIGYATGFNLVAETSASTDKDTDNIAIVDVKIVQGKDSYTGLQADIPGGVESYILSITGDETAIEILEVRGVSPFDSPVYDLNDYINTGTFSISATASSPIQPADTVVVNLVVRLIGDALTTYDLTIEFQEIIAADPPNINILEENPNTPTFLRGDSNKDGVVNIVDAMFIAQYIVEIRDINEINAVNAASVQQGGSSGDEISIVDAMFIAQYIVELRDENFELVP